MRCASTHIYRWNRDTSLISVYFPWSARVRTGSPSSSQFARCAPHRAGVVSAKPHPRNARAAANDVAIADAAVGELLRVGVDRVSLREVALGAGLTHGATYARYEDASELLIDLWRSKLSGCAVELLELSIQAVEEQGEAPLRALFERIRQPRPEDIAMVESLLVSRRIPILFEEMEPFVEKHIYPGDDLTEDARALFLRSLSLFGLSMASMLEGHYFNDDQNYLDVVERGLTVALREKPIVVASDARTSDEIDRPVKDDDNLRARLVYATYVVVAKGGYHEATVSRIARRADCSPGAIYKLYRSKQDLVLDSFRAIFGTSKNQPVTMPGSRDLAEILSGDSNRLTGNRMYFAMETTIAAAHDETLRPSVGAFLSDPEGRVPQLGELGNLEKSRTGEFVHAMATLRRGTQWMRVVMANESSDFEELAESFRVALIKQWASLDS